MSDDPATAGYKALWRDRRTTDTVMRLNAQTVRELAEVAVEAARPITARQVVLKLHSEGFIEGGYVSAALSAVEAEDR